MRDRTRALWPVLSILLLVVACSGTPKKKVDRLGLAREWTTIKVLLPGDAVGILSLSSLTAAQALVDSIMALADDSDSLRITDLLSEHLTLSASQIDFDRPLAVAVSLRNAGMPTPMVSAVLPVQDEQAVLAELRASGSFHVRGSGRGYVVVSMAPHGDLPDALSGITARVPTGDIALRVDLQAIIRDYRLWVDQALAYLEFGLAEYPQLEGTDFSATTVGWLRRLVDSAEQLNVSLDHADTDLKLNLQIDTSENIQSGLIPGPKAQALIESMRCLPGDSPAFSIQSVNLEQLVEWVSAINMAALLQSETMPTEEEQEELLQMMAFSSNLNVLTAVPNWAAFRLGDGGIEWIQVLMPDDVESFMQRFQELMRSGEIMSHFGVLLRLDPPAALLGHPVQTAHVAFDVERLEELDPSSDPADPSPQEMQELMTQLFGSAEMTFRVIGLEEQVVLVGHPDEELAIQVLRNLGKRGRKIPERARRIFEEHRQPPVFYFELDGRGMMQQVAPRLLEMVFGRELERTAILQLRGGPSARVHAGLWASPGKYEVELLAQPGRLKALVSELELLSGGPSDSDP